VGLCRSVDRTDLVEFFAEFRHVPVIKICAAKMDEFRDLLLDCGNYLRVAVSGRAHCYAGITIQKDIAIRICDPNSIGVVGNKFVIGARIAWCYVLGISVDDLE
jgi:hypothetical protein